jgi:hypothetical protein
VIALSAPGIGYDVLLTDYSTSLVPTSLKETILFLVRPEAERGSEPNVHILDQETAEMHMCQGTSSLTRLGDTYLYDLSG